MAVDLQSEWNRWTSVVKFAQTHRPAKMSKAELFRRMYVISNRVAPVVAGGGGAGGGPGGPGGPGPVDGFDADVGDDDILKEEPASDAECVKSEDASDSPGDDTGDGEDRRSRKRPRRNPGGAGEGASDPLRNRDSRECRVLRQWLFGSLVKHSFLTITVPAEHTDEDEETVRPFQVLSLTTLRKVKTFDDPDDDAPHLSAVAMQPLERWYADRDDRVGLPKVVETFPLESATTVDVLLLVGTNFDDRSKLIEWDIAKSDIEGCTSLVHPRPVQCRTTLESKDVPFLAVLDALQDAGYTGVSRNVDHTLAKVDTLEFDERCEHTWYLKCVLVQRDLFRGGCQRFDGGQIGVYYQCLLHNPTVPSGLSGKDYRGLLRKSPDTTSQALDNLQKLRARARPFRQPKRAARGGVAPGRGRGEGSPAPSGDGGKSPDRGGPSGEGSPAPSKAGGAVGSEDGPVDDGVVGSEGSEDGEDPAFRHFPEIFSAASCSER